MVMEAKSPPGETERRNTGGAVFGLAALGLSITSLIASLTRPVQAAETPTEVIVDGDVRKALAALLLGSEEIANALSQTNSYLAEIIRTLGGLVPGETPIGETPILTPFLKESETLASGDNFSLYDLAPGKGALIWSVIDVTDPDTSLIFHFDDLVWEFKYTTLYNEGIDRPLFPGVWLSKYDAANSHYAVIFSAGNLTGFTFKKRLSVVVRFNGTGTATLTEGRGVLWTYS